EDRFAALSMAAAIAVEDGVLASAESEVVRMMQRAFQLTDDDVEAALEAARQDRLRTQPTEATETAIEHSYLEVLLLMAAADGVLEPRELERFSQQLVERPEFTNLGADQVGTMMDKVLRDLQRDGLDVRLDEIALHLTSLEQRLMAFQMALEMCIADGTADDHERTLLKLLQERFELPNDMVAAEIDRVLAYGEG
ncbi:MAG: tellurite resistance TerB family protein, partial [Myxococcota bacterium]